MAESTQAGAMARLDRNKRMWDLRQRGWTLERIGAEFGVSAARIHQLLARVSKRTLEEMTDQALEQKMTQTRRLEYVYDQAMQAWERSQKPAEKLTRKLKPRGVSVRVADNGQWASVEPDRANRQCADVDEETLTSQGQCGDPRYLAEARAVLADLRKLWGLDAPDQHEHRSKLTIVGVRIGRQGDRFDEAPALEAPALQSPVADVPGVSVVASVAVPEAAIALASAVAPTVASALAEDHSL